MRKAGKRRSTMSMSDTPAFSSGHSSILDLPLRNTQESRMRAMNALLPLKRTVSYDNSQDNQRNEFYIPRVKSEYEIAQEIQDTLRTSKSQGMSPADGFRDGEIKKYESRIMQLENMVYGLKERLDRTEKLNKNLKVQLKKDEEEDAPAESQIISRVCVIEDFMEDDNESNIVYGTDGCIERATLPKLIEKITDIKSSPKDAGTFLLTFTSFTTPQCLLKSLICRYEANIPASYCPSQAVRFLETEQQQIRLRVLNALKIWVSEHFTRDFSEENSNILMNFLQSSVQETNRLFAKKLMALIKQSGGTMQSQKKEFMSRLQKLTRSMNEVNNEIRSWKNEILKAVEIPQPILPKNHKINLSFFEWPPLEVARQLCVIEFDAYLCLSSDEFVDKAWTGKNKEVLSPNVSNLAQRFNDTVNWIGTLILLQNTQSGRKRAIERFIEILEHCYNLHNFNAVLEIIGGLQSIAINRLKFTWEDVSKKHIENYLKICEVVSPDGNHKKLRELLPKLTPPKMPYIGLFLTDIVMWEDGTKNLIDGMINFRKHAKFAEIIQEIELYQTTPYPFQVVPELNQYLIALQYLEEDDLYNLSLRAEPRKK